MSGQGLGQLPANTIVSRYTLPQKQPISSDGILRGIMLISQMQNQEIISAQITIVNRIYYQGSWAKLKIFISQK